MTSSNTSQRAELVSHIWALKQGIEANRHLVEGINFVHFNAMLRDQRYRREICELAAASDHAVLRDLAGEILAQDPGGELIGSQLAVQAAPAPVEPPAAETPPAGGPVQQSRESPGRSERRWPRSLLVPLGVLGLFVGLSGFFGSGLNWYQERKFEEVSGSLTGNIRWEAERTYLLKGVVFVEAGAQLNIEAGTRVLGEAGSALVVTRDGMINARGSRERPVLFTSARKPGTRGRGDWGGVVLLGNAPVNTGTGHIEGIDRSDPRGAFGGADETDNCGVLNYVRIEFAGHEMSTDNELNGLTLGGCGSGTLLRYVQVHMGLDDGIEFFGGTANLKHVVISRPGDDGLDWDMGWRGLGQFIVVQQGPEAGDNGIEADNLKSDPDSTPRSAPSLANLTLVGARGSERVQRAMTLRRGTGGDFRNLLITGYGGDVIDIRDAATVQQVEQQGLRFASLLIADPPRGQALFEPETGEHDDDQGFDEQRYFAALADSELSSSNPLTGAVYDLRAPDFIPPAGSPAEQHPSDIPQGEFWDQGARYRGAFRPGSGASWMAGWTAFPES